MAACGPTNHPDWTWEGAIAVRGVAANNRDSAADVGLVHLARPAAQVYPGITPAPIIPAGALNAIKQPSKTIVTQAGYGIQQAFPPKTRNEPFLDGTRNQSAFPLQAIRAGVVFNHANQRDAHGFGMPCAGDSGSPWFLGSSVAAVFSFAWGTCSHAGGVRLDTGTARAFLRSRGLVP
jgi:Trypsin